MSSRHMLIEARSPCPWCGDIFNVTMNLTVGHESIRPQVKVNRISLGLGSIPKLGPPRDHCFQVLTIAGVECPGCEKTSTLTLSAVDLTSQSDREEADE